jgi:hypothetical protein
MLQLAMLHKAEVESKLAAIMLEPKYWYYFNYAWREPITLETHTFNRHQFVSIKDGVLLGYIAYSIDRDTMNVSSLAILNFGEPNPVFSKDLARALRDIFELYKFKKLRWSVAVGNPIEPAYDRMCNTYGGRIVGVYEKEDMLLDGTIADLKLYELFAENYFAAKNKKSKNPRRKNNE